MVETRDALRALAHYDLPPPDDVTPVRAGLIHVTFAVTVSRTPAYALQRLHPLLATDAIAADSAAVTDWLSAVPTLAPRLVRTRAGAVLAHTDEGGAWRLSTWVPGVTRDVVESPGMAEAAGTALGRFHRVMADCPHRFRSSHPLHNTPTYLWALRAALANEAYREQTEQPEITELAVTLTRDLPGLLLPPLPLRVVHGDPKVSNVRFDPDTGEGLALIDLDTCSRRSVLVDLGDALRSWCNSSREDAPPRFHLDRCEAALRGWAAAGPPLTADERARLPDAPRLITLELASRFLRDVLEDRYFGWDDTRHPSRRAHNLARTRAMIELAHQMAKARADLAALVARL
jgi:Ser/Thr protein kinase RdoA (MazF antagonist)